MIDGIGRCEGESTGSGQGRLSFSTKEGVLAARFEAELTCVHGSIVPACEASGQPVGLSIGRLQRPDGVGLTRVREERVDAVREMVTPARPPFPASPRIRPRLTPPAS